MLAVAAWLASGTFVACAPFDRFQAELDGYTHPTVAQAMFLGFAPVEDEFLPEDFLQDTVITDDAFLQVFLADASKISDTEAALLNGGALSVRVGHHPAVTVDRIDSGLYAATSSDGLVYDVGADTHLQLELNEAKGSLNAKGPEAPDLSLPWLHDPVTPIEVDLRAHDYESAMVIVIDASTGDTTWSNQPDDLASLLDLTSNSDNLIDSFEIPAVAFPEETLYAVGVAGLAFASAENFTGVNTLLSGFMVGQVRFQSVCTLSDEMCSQLQAAAP